MITSKTSVLFYNMETGKYRVAKLKDKTGSDMPVCTVAHFFNAIGKFFEEVYPMIGDNPLWQEITWGNKVRKASSKSGLINEILAENLTFAEIRKELKKVESEKIMITSKTSVLFYNMETGKYRVAKLKDKTGSDMPVCTVAHFFNAIGKFFEEVYPMIGDNPLWQEINWNEIETETEAT